MACRKTGSVKDYQERFLELLARAGPLIENQQVQLFSVGLMEPLSLDVQMQNPQTLKVAMSLARQIDRRNQAALSAQAAARSAPRTLASCDHDNTLIHDAR